MTTIHLSHSFCSASVLRLPAEILQECILYAVDIDPPQIHRAGQAHSCGWLVALWVCHAMRAQLYGDGRLWARAYTHLPQVFGTVRAFARDRALHYRAAEGVPNILPLQGSSSDLRPDFTLCAAAFFERADFASCTVIQVGNTWDGIAHLEMLCWRSPLPRLRVLDVTHDYHIFDTNFASQECVNQSFNTS